jgi:thioredoxin-like negative regulator of GroEL
VALQSTKKASNLLYRENLSFVNGRGNVRHQTQNQTMPRFGLFLCVFFAFSIPAPARAATFEPGTLEEALSRAKEGGRWLLVDLYATWCGPCHDMDDKVWARDEVGRALAPNYLLLRRDGERGEGQQIVARYHVVGYPTLLVLDANGVEVDRLMGFVAPRELEAALRDFRAGKGTLAELEKKLQANPNDEALKLEVGSRHAMRGDARAVDELEPLARGEGKRAPAALLVLGKYYWLRGKKDYAQAERVLRELMRRFPSSAEGEEAPFQLGVALHGAGRDAEARKVLDAWIEAAPKDASRYGAYAWLSFHDGFDRARGIEVAKRGLEVNAKDDALWDTLAELYSAVGKPVEAREAENRALAIKPGDAYYESQLRRFGGAR